MHYAGVYGPGLTDIPCCEAGVNYGDLVGGRGVTGWIAKLPCMPLLKSSIKQVTCEKRRLSTPEEAKAWEEYLEERSTKLGAAFREIRKDARGRRGIAGEIPCPVCGNTLRYTIAKSNGHIWGRCDTPDCLSWMQ